MPYLVLLLLTFSLLNAKIIANIPEASGICFVPVSKKLYVANDEGYIYKLNTKGEILKKHYLGNYDLEGITYNAKKDQLLVAVEDKDSVFILDRQTLRIIKKIEIKKKYKKIKILKKSKKNGVEGIAYYKGEVYLSNQSKIPWPKQRASVVFKLKSLNKDRAKIVQIYNHGYIDIAGLCFHQDYLYMLSDKENLLIKYDIKENKTLKKIKLTPAAQEGLCFDEQNNVYIADDNGYVLQFLPKELGLQ